MWLGTVDLHSCQSGGRHASPRLNDHAAVFFHIIFLVLLHFNVNKYRHKKVVVITISFLEKSSRATTSTIATIGPTASYEDDRYRFGLVRRPLSSKFRTIQALSVETCGYFCANDSDCNTFCFDYLVCYLSDTHGQRYHLSECYQIE